MKIMMKPKKHAGSTRVDSDKDTGRTGVNRKGHKNDANSAAMAPEITGGTGDNTYNDTALLDEVIAEIKQNIEAAKRKW